MKSEENNKKFYGEKVWPIVRLIVNISLFLVFNFVWLDWNPSIASNLQWTNFSSILLRLLLISLPILRYFSNKKSYIELTNIWINIYKPKHYPFFWNMESIKFWYDEIENIQIYFIPKYTFKHNVIITKISENWKKEKIKFYWLNNWKSFASALREKWIKTEYI